MELSEESMKERNPLMELQLELEEFIERERKRILGMKKKKKKNTEVNLPVIKLGGENKRLSCMKKKKKNTEVISCMKNLPPELIIEIISCLPSIHLWPLRFVSKSLFELLTNDPKFAKSHFDRFVKSNPNPSIIALKPSNNSDFFLATEFESCDEALTLQVPFYQHANQYSISGNCNGLLCVNHISDHKQVYIWNPIINDYITISCLPLPSSHLPYFPGYGTHTEFAFGFDQESNVYKVVRVFTERGLTEVATQISVYTIGVDSMWRTIQLDLPCLLTPAIRFTPLVNGVLHWHKSTLGETSYDQIVTFDLKREVMGELPLPCGIKYNEIVELGGLLCVVDTSEDSEINMWVMKEYGLVGSWSKQYVIGIPHGCFYHMVPLGFTGNGEIIMKKDGPNLALYSPRTNTIRDLNGFRSAVFLPYAYIGSIISPTVVSRVGHNLL